MAKQMIDRDKFRKALRSLPDEQIYTMLSEAVEMLPLSKFERLAKRYLNIAQIQSDGNCRRTLIKDVRDFEKSSLHGDYYESFDVNWKNSNQLSKGTRAWIAEFERLIGRCVVQARKDKGSETLEAFEICFSLLRHIDESLDDVLFFADEGGSWQVGVDWAKVLPPWYECLSPVTSPDEYARRVVDVIDKFTGSGREKHIAAAKRAATREQRKALQSQTLPGRAM